LAHTPLTEIAHEVVGTVAGLVDLVVDATVGNGHDTVFLARRVGASGVVHGFDIQPQALQSTAARLAANGLSQRVRLHERGHEELEQWLPAAVRGQLTAAMFNLGYLPGAAREITTRAETTELGLRAALGLLSPGGVLSVLVYPGHDAGVAELALVERLAPLWQKAGDGVEIYEGAGRRAPVLLVARRRAATRDEAPALSEGSAIASSSAPATARFPSLVK